MHSRILGIVTKTEYDNKLINECWDVDEAKLPYYQFEEEGIAGISDYVSRDTNVEEDFRWLKDCINARSRIINDYIIYDEANLTFTFKKGFKEEYFKEDFSKLKNKVNQDNAFEAFTQDGYTFKELIEDRYGFYQADFDGCYDTIDNFIREAKIDVEYKVFDSIDYHF